MHIQISDRMQGLAPSTIREILKVTANPEVISFAAGNPSSETFPAEELAELAAEIFAKEHATALQYGVTEGYAPLRELTRKRISEKYRIGAQFDNLIITSGGQQGIDLAVKCLTNEGDTIICENPSFIGSLNCFRSHRNRLLGIPMDNEGMDIDRLEAALQTEKNVKIIYTIPDFQNPMGVTMPLTRRQRLYDLAVKYNVMVLEDSPYYELRYSGESVPPIKSLDTTGHVIYVGSYSKIIAPGIRVGYALAHEDLIAKMTVAKQTQDVHTNLFFMMLLAKYIERYDLDKHIEKCRQLYKAKRDRMISGLFENLDSRVSFTRPDGGLFLWCELPKGYSGTELGALAASRKLAVVPGSAFDPAENPQNTGFRLNFSTPSMEQIDAGVKLLGECLQTFLK